MVFDSVEFLIFLPIVILAYLACPCRYRWILLLVASYAYYAACGLWCVAVILVSTLVNYTAAIQMSKTPSGTRRRRFMAFGLVYNLGSLFVFKYFVFFNDSLKVVLNQLDIVSAVPALQVLLPVGISFYTLQTLGYLIDVYRYRLSPESHLGIFALYVIFFPKLIAGPIERAGRLIPQLRSPCDFDSQRVRSGLLLILWGLFKKVVIADRLAIYVGAVYDNPTSFQGLPVILATYFFAIQILCDFSGYSDIAIGAARVMGYDLMENFRQPYFSKSLSEFWRRWHISLSTWLGDYLYIPLGGNRVPRWRWVANVMTVFLISGLWHGANWRFVLWGALHGLYLVLEVVTGRMRDRIARLLGVQGNPVFRTGVGIFVTFHFVCLAWVFFRANSISDAFLIISSLAPVDTLASVNAPWMALVDNPRLEMMIAVGFIALLGTVHVIQSRETKLSLLFQGSVSLRWAAYMLLALVILNLGVSQKVPFFYSQF